MSRVRLAPHHVLEDVELAAGQEVAQRRVAAARAAAGSSPPGASRSTARSIAPSDSSLVRASAQLATCRSSWRWTRSRRRRTARSKMSANAEREAPQAVAVGARRAAVRRGDPVAVEEADHAALEDDRGRDVLAPAHDARERVPARPPRGRRAVDHDRPAGGAASRPRSAGSRAARGASCSAVSVCAASPAPSAQWIASATSAPSSMRLSTQRSSAERAARLGRRAVDDLAHRAGLGEALGGGRARPRGRAALEALLDLGGRERCCRARRSSRSRPRPPGPMPPPVAALALAVISSR